MSNAPDPAAVKASFRQPNGFLKLIALVHIIICIGLARGGVKGSPIPLSVDYDWLVTTTTCGFCIIMFLLIIARAMGGMAVQAELVALLLGTIMFIASGSVVIDTHRQSIITGIYNPAMALGAICIATALVMFVDMALTAKNIKK